MENSHHSISAERKVVLTANHFHELMNIGASLLNKPNMNTWYVLVQQ
jgi:hypothetical protein